MACFDPDDLADFIRHQFIINADDYSYCKKIIRPPTRKAKPGSLPLNFRSTSDSDTSSGECSPRYLATVDCESTYDVLQERLRSRIQENNLSVVNDDDKAVKNSAVDVVPDTPNVEFFQFEDASCTPSPIPVEKSITALLLEKTDFVIRSDLAAFARFAAPDIENGQKILVFYPFVQPDPNTGKCFSIIIYAQKEICMSDLVGLCCYEYSRCQRTNDIGSVTQYHLLMAEENGEVDRDLPAVADHRLLSELGSCWSAIALEKRQNLNYLEITNVIVYTITGRKYQFAMDSLDLPLRWLRDQAIKKRSEDEGQEFRSDCPPLHEYVLEAVKRPDHVLDLSKPISSTVCTEFLLLRKNSSRGDFTPTHCSGSAEGLSAVSEMQDNLISGSKVEQRQCSGLSYKKCYGTINVKRTSSSADTKNSAGDSIVFYRVEKMRRYKSKWNAFLSIRMDDFKLVPNQSGRTKEQNSKIFHSSQKTLCVIWNHVGGVEITDRSNSKRVVKIVWLAWKIRNKQSEECQSNHWETSELVSITEDSSLSFESDRSAENYKSSRQKLYEDAHWKILQLEVNVDDAWTIAEKINTIIDDRNSVVRQIYKYSNGGTKKPKKAAEEAFGNANSTQFSSRISPGVRRLSSLTSTITNTISTLLKFLPKHA